MMNKKILAVAVAGAIAAPGLALAQATTSGTNVQVYGLFDQAAQESGQVIDPDDPLAPIRQPGGVNLSQSGRQTMKDRQDLDRQP